MAEQSNRFSASYLFPTLSRTSEYRWTSFSRWYDFIDVVMEERPEPSAQSNDLSLGRRLDQRITFCVVYPAAKLHRAFALDQFTGITDVCIPGGNLAFAVSRSRRRLAGEMRDVVRAFFPPLDR